MYPVVLHSSSSRRTNAYGIPLDGRHAWTIQPWLTWQYSLSVYSSVEFAALFASQVFGWVAASPSRWPLTDWFVVVKYGTISLSSAAARRQVTCTQQFYRSSDFSSLPNSHVRSPDPRYDTVTSARVGFEARSMWGGIYSRVLTPHV